MRAGIRAKRLPARRPIFVLDHVRKVDPLDTSRVTYVWYLDFPAALLRQHDHEWVGRFC